MYSVQCVALRAAGFEEDVYLVRMYIRQVSRWTDHRFLLYDLDLSGADKILICMIYLMLPGWSRINCMI